MGLGVVVSSAQIAVPELPIEDIHLAWSRCEEFWHQAQGSRFFVTGATGFLGYWLLSLFDYANKQGAHIQVNVLVRDSLRAKQHYPHLFAQPWLTAIEGSLESLPQLSQGGLIQPFQYCIHAAADVQTGHTAQQHVDAFQRGLAGVNALLGLINQQDSCKVLVLSSGAVYGVQPPNLMAIPEDYAGAPSTAVPATAYGQLKRVAEWLLSAGITGANQIGFARIFALLGPHLPLDQHFAVGNFIHAALSGKPILISGDGTPLRSYLYVADACVWLIRQLANQNLQGSFLNVGDQRPVSIFQLAQIVSETVGPCEVQLACTPNRTNLQSPARYVPDVSKAHRLLKVESWTDLRQGILKTYAWNKNQWINQT